MDPRCATRDAIVAEATRGYPTPSLRASGASAAGPSSGPGPCPRRLRLARCEALKGALPPWTPLRRRGTRSWPRRHAALARLLSAPAARPRRAIGQFQKLVRVGCASVAASRHGGGPPWIPGPLDPWATTRRNGRGTVVVDRGDAEPWAATQDGGRALRLAVWPAREAGRCVPCGRRGRRGRR